MKTMRKRLLEISEEVGHEQLNEWFLSACDSYLQEKRISDIREYVGNYVEERYKEYQDDLRQGFLFQMGDEHG